MREFGDVVVCGSRSPFIRVNGARLVKNAELIGTELIVR